jgi:alkanesulfonate monooxygenase SsuD/methylene tetrahydromethanopterin reductase-like flavin-dependent oxidoreductase (luciferase family)
MKFSFAMPNTVPVKALTQPFETNVAGADQVVMAKRAEELGYDMIPIPEHFIVPTTHVELSGPHYFHSTVAQAFIAGATQRIRVNSSVTLLPLQHPVIMAKALSTADWMSGGRITVTFGVGWDAAEFKILGVPFHERGRMADEYLAAIIELWTSDSAEVRGQVRRFQGRGVRAQADSEAASADLDRRGCRTGAAPCGSIRLRMVPVADQT